MAILCVDRGDTGSQKQVSGEMCAVLHGYQLEITQQLLNLPQNKRCQDFPSACLEHIPPPIMAWVPFVYLFLEKV